MSNPFLIARLTSTSSYKRPSYHLSHIQSDVSCILSSRCSAHSYDPRVYLPRYTPRCTRVCFRTDRKVTGKRKRTRRRERGTVKGKLREERLLGKRRGGEKDTCRVGGAEKERRRTNRKGGGSHALAKATLSLFFANEIGMFRVRYETVVRCR